MFAANQQVQSDENSWNDLIGRNQPTRLIGTFISLCHLYIQDFWLNLDSKKVEIFDENMHIIHNM